MAIRSQGAKHRPTRVGKIKSPRTVSVETWNQGLSEEEGDGRTTLESHPQYLLKQTNVHFLRGCNSSRDVYLTEMPCLCVLRKHGQECPSQLFLTISQSWKQPEHPTPAEWYVHCGIVIQHNSIRRKDKLQLCARLLESHKHVPQKMPDRGTHWMVLFLWSSPPGKTPLWCEKSVVAVRGRVATGRGARGAAGSW